MGMNPTVCWKEKNKIIQKWWIYYNGKLKLKCFSFSKPSSGLYDGEKIVTIKTIDVLIK